jgi:RHS repeat-associated protein
MNFNHVARGGQFFRRLCLILFLPSLFQAGLRAQSGPSLQTGLTAYQSSQGGDIDQINTGNGNLFVHIPLLSYPQRGAALKLDFSLVSNNKNFTVNYPDGGEEGAWTTNLYYVGHLGSSFALVDDQSILLIVTSQGRCGETTWSYTAQTGDGSNHYLGTGGSLSTDCHEPAPVNFSPLDFTKLAFSGTQTSYVMLDRNGIRYTPMSGSYYAQREDTNGNEINTLDTLGHALPTTVSTTDYSGCTGTLPIASASLWEANGPTGVGTYKLCYVNIAVLTNFQWPYVSEYSETLPFLQSVVLPNGTSWTFAYNSRDPGDPPNVNYGDLTMITFPTGGYISYTYSNFVWPECQNGPGGPACVQPVSRNVATRTVNANDGTGDHIWSYNWAALNWNTNPVQDEVTITDPLNNDVVVTSSYYDVFRETERQEYQGLVVGGSLLKTTQTTWVGSPDSGPGYLPATETTSWANGKTSKIAKTYNPTYGETLTESDYDYGQNAPPPTPLRTVTTQYQALNNSGYLTNNLLDIPASVTITDGNGNQVAQTTYGYDQTSLQSPGFSPPQVDPNQPAGADRGNVTTVSRWLAPSGTISTTKSYYTTGTVYKDIDANNNATMYVYSSSYGGAYLTSVTDPLGHLTQYTYDLDSGVLYFITDPNSQTTSYVYDSMWRLTFVGYPDSGEAWISRQESSFPFTATLTQAKGSGQSQTKTDVFDGLGRVTQEQDVDVEGTDYVDTTYDQLGRTATVSNPHRSGSNPTDGVKQYQYDALGRTTEVIEPDLSTVKMSYTGAAREVSDEGNGSKSVQHVYQADALGRITSACEVSTETLVGGGGTYGACGQDISAMGFLTAYAYDPMGDLTTVTQSGLNPRTYVYDSLSRLTSATNPESGTTTYSYDSNSNMIAKVSPLPNVTTQGSTLTVHYYYDADNRLTSRTYSDGFTPSITYVYDQPSLNGYSLTNPIGRLVELIADNGNSIIWNSYDQMGRIVNQWQCTALNCGGQPLELSYTYDLLGDMLTATNGQGVTLTYTYDTSTRITNVASSLNDDNHPGTLLSNNAYFPPGQLQSALLGNNLTETFDYNSRGRLTSETIGSIYSLSVGYAPNGDAVSEGDTFNGNWTYGYDDFNRLISATETSGANPPAYSYGYDRFGNRWSQTVTAGSGFNSSLAFDANNHITGSSVGTDIAGDVYSANTGNGSTQGFFYYGDGNVDYVTTGGTNQGLYHYDGLGRRTQKTAGSVTYYYYYDLTGHQVAVTDQTGSWKRGEVYVGGKHLATYTGGTTGHTFFDHGDWLSTERARTNSTGSVCETISSLPFGDNQVDSDSCVDVSPMHFTGKERDTESNLDAFGARYYSSTLGLFMSPDPVMVTRARVADPQQLDLYSYVRNNPLTLTDPTGMIININDLDAADRLIWQDFVNLVNSKDKHGNYLYPALHASYNVLDKDPRIFRIENDPTLGRDFAGRFDITKFNGTNDFSEAKVSLNFNVIKGLDSTSLAKFASSFQKYDGLFGKDGFLLRFAETFGHEASHGVFAIDNPAEGVNIQHLVDEAHEKVLAFNRAQLPLPQDVLQLIQRRDQALAVTERYAQQQEKVINEELRPK